MSSIPIACTLSAAELAIVKERYVAAASQYRAVARISAGHADIMLSGDSSAISELLTEMVERESACCSFLRFDVMENMDGFAVRLSVLDVPGFEADILRESVAALFPAATVSSAPAHVPPDRRIPTSSEDW